MKSLSLCCGIDVSKDTLDLFYNSSDGAEHCLQVPNDQKGYQQLLKQLGPDRTYVMESSGPYYLRLAFALCLQGGDVRVENPIRIKRFIQMNLERNKSDAKDARWIYRYARQCETKPWVMPCHQQLYCTQLLASIDLYKRQVVMLTNQLHSLQQLPVICKEVVTSVKGVKAKTQKELQRLEEVLDQYLYQWQSEQVKNLQTIPSLGKKAVALLIIYTEGFTKVSNHRQLIALAGLSPREHTSGSSVRGKKGICKMGNGRLRSMLYMCALSAIKHNGACKELFERLKAKGKNGKLALIAVCNKLLKQAFAIATKGTVYQSNYQSRLTLK